MGDGSRASKAEAKQRHAWLNDGHIPDIYHLSPIPSLIEFKCWTPHFAHGALGRGTTQGGGKPSTTDGHLLVAQGNTAEKAIACVLGHPGRGQPGEPWDRVNGTGYVAARDGDYADAIDVKRFPVRLFMSESYGTVSKASAKYIGWLYRDARKQRLPDTTVYGSHRASPRSFFVHHLTAISHAIVVAEALSIIAAARCMVGAFASTSHSSAPAVVRMVGIAA